MTAVSVDSLLALGFLLGLRHAIEADHLAAISTIATEGRRDIAVPLAHLDIVDANNATQTLLVGAVLAWLHEPQQREFVGGAGLMRLLASDL